MSQAGKIITTGGGGGGSVLTLTGNSGGAVSPSAGGNINVMGDGLTATVTGNPGSNTLTIIAAGRVATAQTVDGSTITLDTIPVPLNSASLINSQIVGAYATASNAALGGNFAVLAINSGGVVSLVENILGAPVDVQTAGTNALINLDTVGATVRIRVTGEGAPNTLVNWKSYTTILNQVTP